MLRKPTAMVLVLACALLFVSANEAEPLEAATAPAEAPAPRAGQALDFKLEDINPRSESHGKELALSDLWAERGVVLQFVASWCKPCRDELPGLQRVHEAGIGPIVLVAADENGHRESVLIVAERSKLTAPLLFSPVETTAELEKHYDYEILPATYFIDRKGTILYMHEGAMPANTLARNIDRILSVAPSAP